MSIYSIWNHHKRLYDYYETSESDAAVSAPKPKHLKPAALGMTPEEAAWPLPDKAKHVGNGKYPHGYVAAPKGDSAGLGFIDLDLTPGSMLVLGVLGFLAWTALKRRA